MILLLIYINNIHTLNVGKLFGWLYILVLRHYANYTNHLDLVTVNTTYDQTIIKKKAHKNESQFVNNSAPIHFINRLGLF